MAVINRRIISMCSAILFIKKIPVTKLPCSAGVLFWWIKDKSSRLFIPNDHVWYRVRVGGKGGGGGGFGGGRKRHHPSPLLPFDLRSSPLVKFFFSPQPFAAVKIRWQLQLCRLWRNHRYHRLWTLQNRFVIHKPVFFHAFLIGKKDFLTVAHYCELDFFKNGIKS